MTDRKVRGWTPAFLLVLAVGTLLRFIELGRFPGVYGDEAWYGVNVEVWLAGEAPFWRTPSGNMLNLLHNLPLVALSAWLPPSFTLLRLPSAVWGALTAMLAFLLLRRTIGDRAARWSAMLIAAAPMLIAYSRFGWDPSDLPLTTLLALAFALRDQPLLCAASCAVSLLVHPVAIFAMPMYAGAWLPHAHRRYLDADANQRKRVAAASGVVLIVSALLFALVLFRAAANNDTWFPSVSMVIGRLTSLDSWLRVLGAVVELVSGSITITLVAGALPLIWRVAAALVCGAAMLLPFVAGWKYVKSQRHAIGMLAGAILGIAALHVLAGPRIAEPGLERYGIALAVPLLVMTAVALDVCAEHQVAARALAQLTILTLLVTTVGFYTVPLMSSGGHASESAYRTTATLEPKDAARRFIIDDSQGAASVRVMAGDWTLYWTVRYLLAEDPRVDVVPAEGVRLFGGERPAGGAVRKTSPDARVYQLGWGGGPAGTTWRYPDDAPILFVHRVQ